MLVFAGQANVYVLRERGPFWSSRPAAIMLLASALDLAVVTSLAVGGVLMTPLPPLVLGLVFAATIAFALVLDGIKRIVFAQLVID
jgi:H+-transporting ATPase